MIRQLTILGGCLAICGLLSPAYAQAIRPIPADYARGEHQPVTIELYRGQGVNLNFRPMGETIHRVWLDDPSQATLDFDDPGCAALGEAGECAATVIHLRRIHPLNFPNLPSTGTTLLTVLTEQGLYQFRLTFPSSGSPSYYTLEIQPERTPSQLALIATNQIQGQSGAQLIEQGLRVAQSRSLIAAGDPLWERVQTFLTLIRGGGQIPEAAVQAGISQALVRRLAELGQQAASR